MGTHEFNNRIEAQRAILKVVNAHAWETEQLFSLSRKGIDRWVRANRLDANNRLVRLLLDASAGLFFLASKSQEQVSQKYISLSERIFRICGEIEVELTSYV
jgi:hypothetical protein